MSASTIDAVISWVDGYDPAYQQRLKAFCASLGVAPDCAVEPTRIQQCNEIYYCLQGIRRFAPWIRNIYLITNNQIPAAITAFQGTSFGNKLKIIDQNNLLGEEKISTPIFNSLSAEWLIWKIRGLSKQFLYFNDDFFIIRPVTVEDFFYKQNIVLRGEWKVQAQQQWLYRIRKLLAGFLGYPPPKFKTNPHRAWQERSAQLAGWQRHFYLLPHAPFPLIRDTFERLIAQQPKLMQNAAYPFRHPEQISSIPLMVHLDIKAQRVIYNAAKKALMVNAASHSLQKIIKRLNKAKQDPRIAFLCMQSLDQASSPVRDYMLTWLKQWLEN